MWVPFVALVRPELLLEINTVALLREGIGVCTGRSMRDIARRVSE
jgi:hypothetical protein